LSTDFIFESLVISLAEEGYNKGSAILDGSLMFFSGLTITISCIVSYYRLGIDA